MVASLAVLAIAVALVLLGGAPAQGADAAEAARGAGPAPGRYAGHLYEGTAPADGWSIRLDMVRRKGKRVMPGWGRAVVFTCYRGGAVTSESIGFWVPRTVIRRNRVVRSWTTSDEVVGKLRLRFAGKRVTGTLEYQVSSCHLMHNKIRLRRKG